MGGIGKHRDGASILSFVADPDVRLRVLLADDQVVAARGAAEYLAALGIDVCGTVTDPRRLVRAYEQHVPDVVMIEITMGGRGTAFAEVLGLLGGHPDAAVLVFTSDLSPTTVAASVEHGCLGVVPKTCSVDALGNAVRTVAARERFMHPRAITAMLQTRQASEQRRSLRPLSARELSVLGLAAEGFTNAEIGEQLGIGAETVKTHLTHVQEKLHARDRTHAVSRALRLGVLT